MTATDGTGALLLLGGPSTGKTHYGGQLLGRLQERPGRLRMRGVAADISPFEEALTRLNQGLSAGHTSAATYREIVLPVELNGYGRAELVWPDYGGEQVRRMVEQRQVDPSWRERIEQSNGWLLFIRPDQLRDYEDVVSRPLSSVLPHLRSDGPNSFRWSDQASLVELLQFLLYLKGVGTLRPVQEPALAVLLTCWDELGPGEAQLAPSELLRRRVPLFADFVDAVWSVDARFVYGLSSLGKSLRSDQPDAEYLKRGPEHFGYVVLSDGRRSPDLTLPVSMLLERWQ